MEFPAALEDALKHLLKDEYDAFKTAMRKTPHGGLRLHSGKIKGDEAALLGLTQRVPWTENGYQIGERSFGKHPFYHGGIFYIQEPSAMLPAEVLHPQKGDWVLDICAAPGGKSTRLSEYLNGTGFLVCNDISNNRCRALLRNMELFGMTNAAVTNETPQRLSAFFGAVFDKVLVDAPCSGQGMFRKDPKLLKEYVERKDRPFTQWQKDILESAAELTAEGGEILYSTCTFTQDENEDIIGAFLDRHPEFHLLPIKKEYGFVGGVSKFTEVARLFPHKVAGEGHFVAHLKKDGMPCKNTFDEVREISGEAGEIFKIFCLENKIQIPLGVVTERKNGLSLRSSYYPELKGLKTVGAGTYLGEIKNKRFVPSHPFALSLTKDAVEPILCYNVDSREVADYLKGLTLKGDAPKGFHLVFANDFPLGWVKSDGNGILKNHYPKVWRNI